MRASRWNWTSASGWSPTSARMNSMILANHGLLCAGRTIPEAFSNIYYLERACQAQVAALSGGCELIIPSKEVCEHTAQQFEGDGDPSRYDFMWESCLRLIENDRPDYRS